MRTVQRTGSLRRRGPPARDWRARLAVFDRIAAQFPVFRVTADEADRAHAASNSTGWQSMSRGPQ